MLGEISISDRTKHSKLVGQEKKGYVHFHRVPYFGFFPGISFHRDIGGTHTLQVSVGMGTEKKTVPLSGPLAGLGGAGGRRRLRRDLCRILGKHEHSWRSSIMNAIAGDVERFGLELKPASDQRSAVVPSITSRREAHLSGNHRPRRSRGMHYDRNKFYLRSGKSPHPVPRIKRHSS